MQQVHFIGIGGVGMSALAHLLLDRSATVSGSDIRSSAATEALAQRGAQVFLGQARAHVQRATRVVYSSGISVDNPEYQEAKRLGVPLEHRSALLAQLLEGKKSLLVTGTHGKTTTSSLLAHVCLSAGLDPSFAIGGVAPTLDRNGRGGGGELFVAEADESDGSFLNYTPFGAILTNADEDHLEYWKTGRALLEGFARFLSQVSSPEHLFLCADDPALALMKHPGHTYGFSEDADLRLSAFCQQGWKISFAATFEGKHYPAIEIPLIGRHNALNGAAVFGTALKLGIPEEEVRAALASFRGVGRRAEKRGEARGVAVYDDYAHHPAEIATTLHAIKRAVGERRVVVALQPHRYSRLQSAMEGFAEALGACEAVVLTDIYSASEAPIPGVTIEALRERIAPTASREVHYAARGELVDFLTSFLKAGDVLVTMGAGDITHVGEEVLERYVP